MSQAGQIKKLIKQTVGSGLRKATIKRIHGNTVTVQVGGSPRWLRDIPVIGGTAGLIEGDRVVLAGMDGEVVAQRYVRR